jgi:hypothetical protein
VKKRSVDRKIRACESRRILRDLICSWVFCSHSLRTEALDAACIVDPGSVHFYMNSYLLQDTYLDPEVVFGSGSERRVLVPERSHVL